MMLITPLTAFDPQMVPPALRTASIDSTSSRSTFCTFPSSPANTGLKAGAAGSSGVTVVTLICWRRASPPDIRPECGLSGTSLHQSFEGSASFGDLWEAGVRAFKVREKFLVLVD